uniref:putative quinol monooxygenase n=1 Tax=Shimia sp. TaxID=1954381 RepID=UPI0035666F31
VPQDRLDAVRAALSEHIALTRAEPGCIAFQVTEDHRHPGRFVVFELFENRAAFDAHQARTRASAWFALTRDMKRDYRVTTEGTDEEGA